MKTSETSSTTVDDTTHKVVREDNNNTSEHERLLKKYGDLELLPPLMKYSLLGGKYIDTKTKNVDFIKMSRILIARGIKPERASMFIKVYDPGLIGIDPHDPNLSRDLQKRVLAEVSVNFWYFLRECVRFRAPGGAIPCQLNLGNAAFYFSRIMCLDVIMELPRQHGKTGSELLWHIWCGLFILTETEIGMANKAAENLIKDIADTKVIIEALPSYLQIYNPQDGSTGNNNAREIFVKARNLRIRTFVSGHSQVDANSKARGFSFPLATGDEAPFIPNFKTFFLAFSPAMSKQKELAKLNKVPYGLTLSGTSGTLTHPDQRFFKVNLIDNAANFTVALFNFTDRLQVVEYINRNAKGVTVGDDDEEEEDTTIGMIYLRFDYKMLGRGKKYYNQMCKDLHYDEDQINKDVNLKWVDYSRISPFRRQWIERLDKYKKDSVFTLMVDDYYPLEFFIKITDFDFTYLITCDVSRGGGEGSDSSCIMIHDPRTFEVVARYTSNVIDIPQLEFLLLELGINVFPNSCIAPEVNGLGNGLVQRLSYNKILRPRLFHEKMDLSKNNTPIIKDSKNLKSIDFGFLSVKTARNDKMEIMYKHIINHVLEYDYDLINDPDLIDQIGTLEKNPITGKISNAPGTHKDNVSAFTIGRYILLYSPTITKWIKRENIRSVTLDSGTEFDDVYSTKRDDSLTRNILNPILSKLNNKNPSGKMNRVLNFLNTRKL